MDIILVLDSSFSMLEGKLTVDGKHVPYADALNRLARGIIKARRNDRIGIAAMQTKMRQ